AQVPGVLVRHHAVADGEQPPVGRQLLLAEGAAGVHQGAPAGVEIRHVRTAVGDHHRATVADRVAGRVAVLPPPGDQLIAYLTRRGRCADPIMVPVELHRLARLTVAQTPKRL